MLSLMMLEMCLQVIVYFFAIWKAELLQQLHYRNISLLFTIHDHCTELISSIKLNLFFKIEIDQVLETVLLRRERVLEKDLEAFGRELI